MEKQIGARVIHSYDPVRRQVLCGIVEQTNSTKHAGDVTCVTCRELLDGKRATALLDDAPGAHGA